MAYIKKKIGKFLKSNEFVVLAVLFLVSALFSILNPAFLTVRNFYDLLRTLIVYGIFACGLMMVIINGGVDMSFMAISICSAYITIRIAIAVGFNGSVLVLLIVSAFIGLLFGLCNAFLISKFQIPIFIVTLSVANVIRGLVLAFVGNEYVPSTGMPSSTIAFSKGYLFNTVDSTGAAYGLHFSIFITFALMGITHLILNYTIIGRGVYALGGDMVSAGRIGFDLKKIRCFIYGYAGVLAGIAGMVYVSNNRMADPVSFQGEELAVIAAVVMGGTRITGGKGTVLGIFLGLMLTQVINNNLSLINVPSFWQKFTFGCLIIVAVVFQAIKDKKEARV